MASVSVIMPVRDGAGLLGRAVASMRAQAFADWELLVTDDGSADGTAATLARIAGGDPRVRVFTHAASRGPAAARNTALRAARGEWIAYLDHDDEFDPGHLARVWEHRAAADVLIFPYDLIEERPNHPDFGGVRRYDPAPHLPFVLDRPVTVPLGVAHRRDLLARAGLFDESLQFEEDRDLWRRFALAGAKFVAVPHASGRYHVRADSQARRELAARTAPPADVVTVEVRAGTGRYSLRVPARDAGIARDVFEKAEYSGVPVGKLRAPPLVVDVGAHVGAFALYVKLAWHADAVVHCFEPYPPHVELLRTNLAAFPGVHVHPVGLGTADTTAELRLHPAWGMGNSLNTELVPNPAGRIAVPIRDAAAAWDEIGLAEVDVLKVDCEGAEADVLGRLGQRLAGVRVVLVEYHSSQLRRQVDALLPGHEIFGTVVHRPGVGVLKYVRMDLLG